MKVIPIFVEQNQGICTIILREGGKDELEQLEELWNDPEYLLRFFTEQKNNLANGIYSKFTIREAALKTQQDAAQLFDQLFDLAQKGMEDPTDNLSQLFVPLHPSDKLLLTPYEQCKAYGIQIRDSWLRLYAIRLNANTFVITGGGIKLVKTMQQDERLMIELQKLKETQAFLKDSGIIDADDI